MDDIIKRVLNIIKSKDSENILINNEKSKINPHQIKDIVKINTDKTTTFIDGGNLEIIRSPSLSLFFNRIYSVTYQNNKRINKKTIEFYSLIHAENKNNNIIYTTEYFFTRNKLNLKKYSFDSLDSKLCIGNKRTEISLIGNIIRRFSEIHLATESKSDIIILDGNLDITYPYEDELIKNLLEEKKCVLGLAKTSELITDSGNSVIPELKKLSTKKEWYYLINTNNHISTYKHYVKLNKNSEYIFRLDSSKNEIDDAISILKENAKDPIFPGYPYGLIDADRNARVSNKEKEMLEIKLRMKLGKNYEMLIPYINSLNAHNILDSVS